MAELEKRLPAGAKLVRLHLSDDDHAGMAAFAPLFATLTVMGIEAQHRPAAYRAIIKENLNLADEKQLSAWLVVNGIDEAAYQRTRDSERVKELLAYMTAVSRYYQVNATPALSSIANGWRCKTASFPLSASNCCRCCSTISRWPPDAPARGSGLSGLA
ncbi:DsbA family protein [Serratia ureilytica]